jgi:hypothetical protein
VGYQTAVEKVSQENVDIGEHEGEGLAEAGTVSRLFERHRVAPEQEWRTLLAGRQVRV